MKLIRLTIAGLCFASSLLLSRPSPAATVTFNGNLDHIAVNSGAAVFSGIALGTAFSGTIDDVTANGRISGGGVTAPFGCCIAAGALSITNDRALPAEDATLLNLLAGAALFSAGEIVDGVDLEGDAATPSGGRIEVGLSYVFAPSTFANESPSNYPFNPAAARLAHFFVLEQDVAADDIYLGFGRIATAPIPEPETYALFLAGLAAVALGIRRVHRKPSR